jgi:hypothetical protein
MISSDDKENNQQPIAFQWAKLVAVLFRAVGRKGTGMWSGFSKGGWKPLVEAALVVLWAVWIGRGYLDFSTTLWPRGDEIIFGMESQAPWTLVSKCGLCMLWNGTLNGGAPAFAEAHGATTHPYVIITTLLFGMINGMKIQIILSLATAGLGSWWIVRVLGLRLVPRLWSAAMVVVGGHLMGKMDNGGSGLMLALACASLILAFGVELALTRRRRALVWLAIAMALTWLSGTGYIPIAVMVCVLPPFTLLCFDDQFHLKPVWKDFVLAFGISILLTAIWWAPLLHFWGNFAKDGDPYLAGFPPLEYNPLNLVIRDWKFFQIEILGHTLNLYHYFIYIGWVPVLLAIFSLRPQVSRERTRLMAFFWLSIGLIFLVCSSDFIRAVEPLVPQVTYLRYFYISAGLAVPYVLALAAWGLDALLKLNWPRLGILLSGGRTAGLSLAWLVVGIPILLALKPGYDMSVMWLGNVPVEIPEAAIRALTAPSTQWVTPPIVEYPWVPVLIDHGLKVTGIFQPWHWKDREPPMNYLEANRTGEVPQNAQAVVKVADLTVFQRKDGEYAYIRNGEQTLPCQAGAQGGNIDVVCNSPFSSQLVVKENQWSGWTAYLDGKPVRMVDSAWLSVDVPAGEYRISFRYQPWDVWAGLLISVIGVFVASRVALQKVSGAL